MTMSWNSSPYVVINLPFLRPKMNQALEHIGGKYPLDCLALFRHFMVDVIISSSHGYRQGALNRWILGGRDPIATAISDFPKRGIVVGAFRALRGTD